MMERDLGRGEERSTEEWRSGEEPEAEAEMEEGSMAEELKVREP